MQICHEAPDDKNTAHQDDRYDIRTRYTLLMPILHHCLGVAAAHAGRTKIKVTILGTMSFTTSIRAI